MAAADALAQTPLERRFLDELRHASGEVDGPMERHGVRCFMGERPLTLPRIFKTSGG